MKAVEQMVICPYCGYHADRVAPAHDDGSVPKDGDFSMCIDCGKFSVFEAALPQGLRKPDMAEKFEIIADVDCFKAHWAWQQVVAKRKLQ